MKQVIVISGKGGTGKTTLTASLALLVPRKVIVDADVDAANLHILLKPKIKIERDFKSRAAASIDQSLCTQCGKCKQYCRFDAVQMTGGKHVVDEFSCEGCHLCSYVCPVNAVNMEDRIAGKWFVAETEWGPFVYARLVPGAENSGSLVAAVKKEAVLHAKETGAEMLLIDGPPGIGCPVISAISGTDLAVIAIEPTYSGISDLERIYDLTRHFKIKCGIVVNRFDINTTNTKKIEAYAKEKNVTVYAKIPHLTCIMNEITAARMPSLNCKPFAHEVKTIYTAIMNDIS
jgi:MinD superfamily P-loop ATPase